MNTSPQQSHKPNTDQTMKKPLKVLQFICPTGFYGAERWILALAKHLNPEEVICDLVVTKEFAEHDLELVRHYKAHGKTFELPMSGRFDLSIIKKLTELIKTEGYDIIHTHGYKSDILGVIAAKKAGIKCICTPHGFENSSDLKLRLFIWLGCQSFKFADAVAPLSRQLCDDVKKYNVKTNKLVYIQNGVDLSEVEEYRTLRPAFSNDKKEKVVGFIGQMISRKNIFHILDIFDQLNQRHPNLKLKLLGDGDQRKELEAHTALLTNRSNIEFLGFRDDRLDQLKDFDLFVMTSSLEGIPRCLMEAMAMGVPVAAYNIPGIDQLLEHNKTGLLANLNDQETLSQYWEALLFQQETAERLSEAGRQFVLEHYSAQRMANEYVTLFERVMTRPL